MLRFAALDEIGRCCYVHGLLGCKYFARAYICGQAGTSGYMPSFCRLSRRNPGRRGNTEVPVRTRRSPRRVRRRVSQREVGMFVTGTWTLQDKIRIWVLIPDQATLMPRRPCVITNCNTSLTQSPARSPALRVRRHVSQHGVEPTAAAQFWTDTLPFVMHTRVSHCLATV